MRHYLTLLLMLVVAALATGCGVAAAQDGGDPQVFLAEVSKTTDRDDGLTDETVSYLERVISDAEAADATVAIELSTAGGALNQTQEIVGMMGEAKDTPIIVYVTPRSTRAASAGTFILMAGDVAAMAPETRTGAATPVTFFGQDIPGDLGSKVRNDAVALLTGIAETHDRNEQWAEKAIRDAEAVNAEEALELGVIEYVEPDLRSLLKAADGGTVEPKGIELNTANAELVDRSVSFKERFGFSRWYVIIPAVLLVLLLAGLTYAVVRTSRQRVSTGREGMIGEVGTVRHQISKSGGTVFVHGELWTALPEEPQMAPIETGAEVEIVSFRRTAIVVRPSS
ncbi:hypothetical protein BH24ACT22_BH24ACT22_15490 [soil metagenome]